MPDKKNYSKTLPGKPSGTPLATIILGLLRLHPFAAALIGLAGHNILT